MARRLQPEEADYLGPVAIAQFVDARWLTEWPLEWTRGGRRAIANGFGRWEETAQGLPFATSLGRNAVPYWEGRRHHRVSGL